MEKDWQGPFTKCERFSPEGNLLKQQKTERVCLFPTFMKIAKE
ncbi:MAG: hypothetical protein Q4D17_02340 [Planctomycetia bacterium]|nr:hypothetical protein [Planctomycetia bacterium]